MAYQPRAGDVIALDNEKAGSLVASTSLANFTRVSTDPIRMFARRDAFRTVSEAIAWGIASVPFDLYQRDAGNGRSKLHEEDDPVAAALENPTAHLTQYRFIESLMLDHVLHDRWAFLVNRTAAGGLEFLRLPGSMISFAVDGFRRVTDVVVSFPGGGRSMPIPADSCVFDVGYDPYSAGSSTTGFPISQTLESSAAELEYGANYRSALLHGGPKVPMYIKRPAGSPEWIKSGGRARFVETFKAYSAEKAGGVPILEDGMELAAAPQLNVNDVQYQSTRLAAQIEFAIALHFPPELIGYRAGNFSNIEALREQLYVDVLGGRIAAFRQALNAGLRAAGVLQPGRYIEENLASRLASSPEKQASILQTQVGAPIRTVNEARRLQNLPPVPGGDDLIVPLNVTKGGLASPTDTAPKALPTYSGRKAIEGPPSAKAAAEKQRDRFAGDLSKAFRRQAARVQAGLGSDSSPGSLEDSFDLDLENEELASVIYPHSFALALTGAAVVLDKFNPDRANFNEDVMMPWVHKAAAGTANMINRGTLDRLAGSIFGPEWQKATADLFTGLADAQAEVWAQTVATTSLSFGSSDAAKASGLRVKTWRQSGSKEPRPEHASLDGETVAAGDLFSNGMRWPGDPVGGADQNANCHCQVEYGKGE